MQSSTVLIRRVPYAVQVALMAATYFVAAKMSLPLAIPPGYATAVWPPSGIALAAMLLLGRRLWPGIWIGAAMANLTVEASAWSARAGLSAGCTRPRQRPSRSLPQGGRPPGDRPTFRTGARA